MGTERKCDIDGGGVTFGGTYSFSVRSLRRCIKSGQKTGSDGVKQRLINREGKRTPLVTPLMSAMEMGGGEWVLLTFCWFWLRRAHFQGKGAER